MGITELAGLIRQQLAEDERIAREACGSTVVGEPGNWRQAPGGDEWVAHEEDGAQEVLVALRPGLPRPPDVMGGLWGAVWARMADEDDDWTPMPAFTHAARHDPRRVLADVVARRRLLDEALGWEHVSLSPGGSTEVYCAADLHPDADCDCGRDERVHAVLQLLATPYQETT